MKIIRVLWGDKINHEIPPFPLLENEVVYVWGEKNNQMLLDRGWKTRLLSSHTFEGEFNGFGKKIFALNQALEEFNEVLLLDWDCYLLKPLDDKCNAASAPIPDPEAIKAAIFFIIIY